MKTDWYSYQLVIQIQVRKCEVNCSRSLDTCKAFVKIKNRQKSDFFSFYTCETCSELTSHTIDNCQLKECRNIEPISDLDARPGLYRWSFNGHTTGAAWCIYQMVTQNMFRTYRRKNIMLLIYTIALNRSNNRHHFIMLSKLEENMSFRLR